MADDSAARRDAWRDARTATTVTGRPAREPAVGRGSGDIHIHIIERPTGGSEVTDPANAAPGHPALTNVGTIHDG
jgi:hypothetical protein